MTDTEANDDMAHDDAAECGVCCFLPSRQKKQSGLREIHVSAQSPFDKIRERLVSIKKGGNRLSN